MVMSVPTNEPGEKLIAGVPAAEFYATEHPFAVGQYYFNHDEDLVGPYDLEKAYAYFAEAIRRDPDGNNLAWLQFGRVEFLRGNFESAIGSFNKQLEYFGSEVPNVHYMLGLTHAYRARATGNTTDWERAAEAFGQFLTFQPASPWARTDLAWVYFAQGNYEAMLPILEGGLERNPEHPWLHNMYGLALLNIGEREKAREHFLKARGYAATLTPADWGRAYPGNDPEDWERGLMEFRTAIAKNLALSETAD